MPAQNAVSRSEKTALLAVTAVLVLVLPGIVVAGEQDQYGLLPPFAPGVTYDPFTRPYMHMLIPRNTPDYAVFDDKSAPTASVIWKAPIYPELYRNDRRKGKTCIQCDIDISGRVGRCSIVWVRGGSEFAVAGIRWLKQPSLRFLPMTLDNHVVAGSHSFLMTFDPDKPDRYP